MKDSVKVKGTLLMVAEKLVLNGKPEVALYSYVPGPPAEDPSRWSC
jgi:hypothetical protein